MAAVGCSCTSERQPQTLAAWEGERSATSEPLTQPSCLGWCKLLGGPCLEHLGVLALSPRGGVVQPLLLCHQALVALRCSPALGVGFGSAPAWLVSLATPFAAGSLHGQGSPQVLMG